MQIEQSSIWHCHISHFLYLCCLFFLRLSIHPVNYSCLRHEIGNTIAYDTSIIQQCKYRSILINGLMIIVPGIPLREWVRFIAGLGLGLGFGSYCVGDCKKLLQ